MQWLSLFGICLLAFTAFLDFTIVNTALPFIQKGFSLTIFQLQWVSNIFSIVLGMTMVVVGKCADRWGRRKLFYWGIVIFGIASGGAGLSPSIGIITFFRGLQALGASIVFITSMALISEIHSGEFRNRALGIYSAVTGIGLMVGPFLGGLIIGLLDWRWVFWINLPLIIIGLICCLFSLQYHPHKTETKPIDGMGLFLLVVGLGALLYGIISIGSHGPLSYLTWFPLIIGIAFLILLIRFDFKTHSPLLYLTLFKDPLLVLAVLSCALAGMVSYILLFFDPLYLRNLRQLSPYALSLWISIIPAAQLLISLSFPRLQRWLSIKNLLFLSLTIGLIATLLHRLFDETTPLPYLAIPFALLGINWGLSNTAMASAVNQNVTPHRVGEAMGTIGTIWNVAGAIFLALSTVIFHRQEAQFLPAFHSAVEFNLAFMVIVFLFALWTRKKLRTS